MKTEADPITDDEWLLRRIHKSRFKTERTPTISPSAFEPRIKGRDPDTDGISLYREACLDSPDEVLATVDPDKRHEYAIVRLPAKAVREMDLTLESKADERIRGHVVVPELNSSAFAGSKSQFTPTLLELAKLASKVENILLRPRDLD